MKERVPERTFRLRLAYDGTGLVGWQRQPRGASVQALLEAALERIAGGPVRVVGAGRTDAGVHAAGQVASVRAAVALDTGTLRRALNALLPGAVRVIEVSDAGGDFHARHAARSKTYEYRVVNGPIVPPLVRTVCWHVPQPLALDALRGEAAALLGEHDFSAFRSTGSSVRSSVRGVLESSVRAVPLARAAAACALVPIPRFNEGRLIVFRIRGTGFLRHMVRAIVGTIVQVGAGELPRRSIERLLADGTRGDAGVTAPAAGLCLVSVDYEDASSVAAHR